MAIITDEAIVLRQLDYSETSQILVVFTREHGKIRAIAKGVKRGTKKRFAAGIDLLDVGTISISARSGERAGLATMTEWKQTGMFAGLREHLPALYAGLYATEITSLLTEDFDPHPGVFGALQHLLTHLTGARDRLGEVVLFQKGLLVAVGSMPEFERCVVCNRMAEDVQLSHFSSHQGGMLCEPCATGQGERRRVRAETRTALQQSEPDPAAPVPEGAFALLDYHIAHLVGKQPLLSERLLAPHRLRNRGSS